MGKWLIFSLGVSSLVPWGCLLLLKHAPKSAFAFGDPEWSGLAVFGLVLAFLFCVPIFTLAVIRGQLQETPLEGVESIHVATSTALGGFFAYTLPLVNMVVKAEISDPILVVIAVFFAVLFARSDLVYASPVLGLAGYRLYTLKYGEESERYMLSRSRHVILNESLCAGRVLDHVYLQLACKEGINDDSLGDQ